MSRHHTSFRATSDLAARDDVGRKCDGDDCVDFCLLGHGWDAKNSSSKLESASEDLDNWCSSEGFVGSMPATNHGLVESHSQSDRELRLDSP